MLYAYSGSESCPVWGIAVPVTPSPTVADLVGGTGPGGVAPYAPYAFQTAADRPGGPIVFTSPESARRFLRDHAALWGPLHGAQIIELGERIGDVAAAWRMIAHTLPVDARLLFIDPRRSFTGVGDVDAETLAL